MADIFLIMSDDPEVVRATCGEAEKKLREFSPDSVIDAVHGDRWTLISSRNAFVPYAASSDSNGAAVVIGSAGSPGAPTVHDLRKRQPELRIEATREICRQLNYGVALSIEDGQVVVTTDYLGLYPVYYHQSASVLMVTSVPGLVRCWPHFRPVLDTEGLVGLLLLAHCNLGHSLLRDVRRLPACSMLSSGLGARAAVEEVRLNAGGDSPTDMDEAVEAFDSALRSSVGASVHDGVQSVLLSGGLDSRIIAGYLHQLSGGALSAVTLGDARDLEMRAAARVASAISAGHERVAVDEHQYLVYAQRELDYDAMTSGLYALNYWALSERPRQPVLTGFLGDPVMGASHVDWGRETLCDAHTFHAMFTRVNAWGLSPGLVRELVRADDIDDIVLDVYRQLRNEYYAYQGQPWQRSWWFDLHHRQRFLIGRLAKIVGVRSWPVLPYVTPAVLTLALATPLSLLTDRKVQAQVLLRRLPAVARLPLADNVANRWYRLGQNQKRSSVRPWTLVMDAISSRPIRDRLGLPERRAAVRFFDFNGPGWNSLRDQARTEALSADAWLNRDLVLQLIPPSTTPVKLTQRILEPTGRRTLIGAVLGCSQYFAGRT
jgi:asparagine synthase (glutamine-hydrolysing)